MGVVGDLGLYVSVIKEWRSVCPTMSTLSSWTSLFNISTFLLDFNENYDGTGNVGVVILVASQLRTTSYSGERKKPNLTQRLPFAVLLSNCLGTGYGCLFKESTN